jgi:twitching motility two-component system response regulator PilG
MQGTLEEIDVRSILQLIELGQRTGELFIESNSGRSWLLFFQDGQILYALELGKPELERLQDYLGRYRLLLQKLQGQRMNLATLQALTPLPEYAWLWFLVVNEHLTPAQGRSLIKGMAQETLFDVLSLHEGFFQFQLAPGLSPQLTKLSVSTLVSKTLSQLHVWKQFYPHIQSPDQYLQIESLEPLSQRLLPHQLQNLKTWDSRQTSIRKLGRYIDRDCVTIAKALYPHVQQGWVRLVSPVLLAKNASTTLTTEEKVPRIVCIDDAMTVRQFVEGTLSTSGYEVTAIANPLKAVSLIFQLNPNLILCDIVMPELNGYELCTMLHSSSRFRHIPVVMLTGMDGFIDRVKARIAGACDYLTKPFSEQELLTLVERYVGLGNTNRPDPNRLLNQALAEEVLVGGSTPNPRP